MMQRRCSCTTPGQFAHETEPMRRWIDELSFGMRVVLTILIVAITMAAIVWEVIEKPF